MKTNWSNICATSDQRNQCSEKNCILFSGCKIKEPTERTQKTIIMALTEMFDEMESKDMDQSTEKWMQYKHIRNSIRDWAQRNGIDIKERNV